MIVISDTTPIISLLKVQQLQLLQKLYGTVLQEGVSDVAYYVYQVTPYEL